LNLQQPTTLPEYKYLYSGNQYLFYSDRNKYRLEDYNRLDIAITHEENLRSIIGGKKIILWKKKMITISKKSKIYQKTWNQIKDDVQKCKEVVTSHRNLVYCSCGYLGVDAGSMLPDGSLVRVLISYFKKW